MRYPYQSAVYWPPFPTIEIILRNEERALQTEAVDALIDTGADASLVPLSFLSEIKAYTVGVTHIRSHWGERRRVYLYRIDIKIDDITLPGITVVGVDFDDEVVLGRDVLNKLRLLLDGPAGHTEILD
jgi:predicted aspartyl protease